MSYIGNIPVPQATQTRDNFTATEGQTSFATSGYSPGYVDVYLNGIHLDPSDYTATDGNSVELLSGATLGDVVSVVAFSTFTVSGNVTGDVNNTTIVTEDVTVNGQAIGTIVNDNDLNFDMTAGNNFKCIVGATGEIQFSSITSGQSGNIWLDNNSGFPISAANSVLISSADLATISSAGVYFLSYYSDGTNVAVSATPGVTSGGA